MLGKDRIEGDLISINKKLLPLSWLYGLGVGFRNLLFEMGILKSRSFSTPVISVGNIIIQNSACPPGLCARCLVAPFVDLLRTCS